MTLLPQPAANPLTNDRSATCLAIAMAGLMLALPLQAAPEGVQAVTAPEGSSAVALLEATQPAATTSATQPAVAPESPQPTAAPDAKKPSLSPVALPPLGPDAWGDLDFLGMANGSHMGPNGVPFHPLAATRMDLNLAILPDKELYIFSETEYWAENRTTDALTGQRQKAGAREYDLYTGLAWQPFSRFEIRGSVFANNNVNRGNSTTTPFGFNDGAAVEGRYYFGKDIYDDGRLSFISLGYAPTKTLIGGDGLTYKPGIFARAYLTYDLPVLGSYVFADGQYMQEKTGTSKILEVNAGVAMRPFKSHQNIELRVGDDATRDLQANVTRSYVYGSVRINFGGDAPAVKQSPDGKQADEPAKKAKQAWGDIDMPFSFDGEHMAPNGVKFKTLFAAKLDVNYELMPDKELYIFTDTTLWAEHSAAGVTNKAQGGLDFSKREYDLDYGLAWNPAERFELRGSAYAMSNLNRGNSLADSSGGDNGGKVELRRYFGDADPYDVGRLSFLSIGDMAGHLIGFNGQQFHPGLFARAYATYDIPAIRSYIYADGRFTAQDAVTPRLLELDGGLAIRPFMDHPHFEVRLGDDVIKDVRDSTVINTVYGSLRLNF